VALVLLLAKADLYPLARPRQTAGLAVARWLSRVALPWAVVAPAQCP
jgi:hypothetical protein